MDLRGGGSFEIDLLVISQASPVSATTGESKSEFFVNRTKFRSSVVYYGEDNALVMDFSSSRRKGEFLRLRVIVP